MAGVRPQWPLSFAQLFTQVREGSMSGSVILLVFGGAIIIIAFISFMELAQRRVLVQYPKRATQRGMQADRSHLPLKVNTSGVIPPIFASSLLLMPLTVTQMMGNRVSGESAWGDFLITDRKSVV